MLDIVLFLSTYKVLVYLPSSPLFGLILPNLCSPVYSSIVKLSLSSSSISPSLPLLIQPTTLSSLGDLDLLRDEPESSLMYKPLLFWNLDER